MSQDIAELGLRVDSTQVRTADRALDDFQGTATATSQKVNLLTGALKLLAAAFAAIKLVKLIEETALLNARFETMGVVMNVAGNNAGYTSKQMADLEQELTKTGISMIKARENLTSLATANIDLSKATKLARAAQDLAVVGNTNSSEAFSRLTQGIKSGEVEVLRTLGLNVNFENSYKKLAMQLGTTTEKLTDQQKMQARTNATLTEAANYAGIYEKALGTAGKQINSLSRYVEDAKVKLGEVFNETLTFAVGTLTDALKAANVELDKMGQSGGSADAGHMLAVGFQEAFKAVLVFGANVLFVLNTLGREIGGFGAILAQVFIAPLRAVNALGAALDLALNGNFKGAADKASQAFTELGNGVNNVKMIWEDLDKQGETSRAALDAYEASVMGVTAAKKEMTLADIATKEALEALNIAVANTQREQDAADAKRLAAAEEARKKAKKAFDEAQTWYKKELEDSKEKILVLLAELAGTEKLTDAEKERIKVNAELDKAGKNLTATQKAKIKADQDAIVYLDKLNTARQTDKKNIEDQTAAAQKDVDGARDTTKSLEDQIKYYGLTTDAVLRLQAAEMERKIFWAQADNNDIEVDRLKRLQVETTKQADLQQKLNQMKAATDFWTGLEQAAHTTFLSISNGNKDLWTRLKETAKNVFFEWLYQQTLKKWIINIGLAGGGTGAVSGIAGAASLAGGAASASSVTGQIGTLAGLSSLITSAGGIVTGAMQTAGALLSGTIGVGQTLSAGFAALTSGSAAGASAGLASLAGTLGPIALGIAGGVALLSKAFGTGPKQINSTALTGTLTPTGATASTVSQWSKSGGWFSSGKSGQDTTPFTADQNAELASAYKGILDLSKVLGDTVGADTTALATRVQQLNIDLTGLKDTAAQQEAITKFFAGVADSIALDLLPNLKDFQKEGEALSATMERVVTNYAAVKDALSLIGKDLGAVGAAGIATSERLIAATGGLDKLSSGLSYFQQNFLTQAEQLVPVQKMLNEQLAAMGFAGVTTAEQFKAATLGIDITTDAGAKLFAQMLALAPTFKVVADARDAEAKAAADAAAVIAKAQADADAALANTNQGYQDQIDRIMAEHEGEAAIRALEIKGMDASTIALYDRLAALNAETKATEEAAALAKEQADKAAQAKTVTDGLLGQIYDLTHSDAEALLRQRQVELATMTAGDAELQKRIWALQEEKAIAAAFSKEAAAAANEAAAAISKAQEAAKTAQAEYIKSVGDDLVKGMNDAAKAANDLQSALTELMTGSLSPMSDQAKYEAAQAAFSRASSSDPTTYSSAGNALLQASQSLYGTGSFEYARDFVAYMNGLQSGIDQQSYVASGVGQKNLYDSIRGNSGSGNSEVVQAVNGMVQAITPVLQKIATSTSTQADLTDQVTQGGRATRTTEA